MSDKLRREDLVEKGIWDQFIAGTLSAEQSVEAFTLTTLKSINAIEKEVGSLKFGPNVASDIEKIEKANNELLKNQKKLEAQIKKLNKVKQARKELTDDELKQSVKIRKDNADRNKQLKNQIQLQEQFGVEIKDTADLLSNLNVIEQREINTIGEARDARRELQKQVDLLNTSIPEEADAIVRLNAVINKNTEFIKENVDQNRVQIETVGDYKNQINEAISETGAFDAILGKLDGTAATIVGAIQGVVGRLNQQVDATKAVGDETKKTTRAVSGLNKTLKASIITVVIVALTAMVAAFTKSREGARELAILTQQLSNSLLLLGKRLLEIGKAIVNVYVTAFNLATRTAKEFRLSYLQIINIEVPKNFLSEKLGIDGFTLASKSAKEGLEELKKELAETPDTEITDVLKSIGNIITTAKDAFSDFDTAFVSTNSRLREFLELQDRLNDQNALREKQIAQILALQEKQQAIADDDTRSLIDQEKAQRKVLVLQSLRLKLQQEIAESELELATKSIQNDLERAGVLDQVTTAQIKNLSFLKDANIADQVSLDNLEKLKEASIALTEVEGEQVTTALEAGTVLNKIRRDQFEQQLDFAIDAFDNVKTLNEQLIADTTRESKERFKILAETNRLNKESFDDQIKLTEDFVRKSIEERLRLAKFNEDLNQDEIKRLSEQLIISEQLDIEALSALKSQRDVRAELNRLGVTDEIVNVRILEIIRERKIATQDLATAERDLILELEMSEQDLQSFRRDVAITLAEEETERRVKDFEESERFNQRKLDAARRAIDLEREARLAAIELEEDLNLLTATNESERTRIIEEANEKRRQINKETTEEIEALNKQSIEKTLEFTDEAFSAFQERVRRQNKEENDRNQEELRRLQDQGNQLADDEEQRIADRQDNLAVNEALQAEAEARAARERRSQIREERALAFLSLVSAKASAGDPNALTNASIEFALSQLATASFDKGVDRTGHPDKPMDNKGGFLAMMHPDEMVIEQDKNKAMGYPSRDKVFNNYMIAENFKEGNISSMSREITTANQWALPDEFMKRFDRIEKSHRNLVNSLPDYQMLVDPITMIIDESLKKGNKIERKKTKIGGGGILGNG